MLVLTRKKSQMIQIGEDIVVKVIQTGRSTVKIGIDAPAHVRVLRGELSEELHHLKEGECFSAQQSLRNAEHQLSGNLEDSKEGESLSAPQSFRRTGRRPPLAAEAVVYEAV